MKVLNISNFEVANTNTIICYCRQVTQKEIERAIKQGARTLSDLQQITGACTGNQCKELNPSEKCCSGDIYLLIKNAGLEMTKPSCCK